MTAAYGRPFAATAGTVGVADRLLLDYPDGALDRVCPTRLVGEVIDAARVVRADGLLVLDTSRVTGPPDHCAASQAVLLAAAALDLPVLGWTVPDTVAGPLNRAFGTSFAGHPAAEIDIAVPVDRAPRPAASAAPACHLAPTGTVQRLPLLGDTEHLRGCTAPEGEAHDSHRPGNSPTRRIARHDPGSGPGSMVTPLAVIHGSVRTGRSAL